MTTRDQTSAAFASRLREARRKAGMTVLDLSRKSGVGADNLYRLEGFGGGPNLVTAVAIARALPELGGLDWLISDGEKP